MVNLDFLACLIQGSSCDHRTIEVGKDHKGHLVQPFVTQCIPHVRFQVCCYEYKDQDASHHTSPIDCAYICKWDLKVSEKMTLGSLRERQEQDAFFLLF